MAYEIKLTVRENTPVAALLMGAATGSKIDMAIRGSRLELSNEEQDVRSFQDLISGAPVKKIASENGVEIFQIERSSLSMAEMMGVGESTCPWDYPENSPPAVQKAEFLLDGRLFHRFNQGKSEELTA